MKSSNIKSIIIYIYDNEQTLKSTLWTQTTNIIKSPVHLSGGVPSFAYLVTSLGGQYGAIFGGITYSYIIECIKILSITKYLNGLGE